MWETDYTGMKELRSRRWMLTTVGGHHQSSGRRTEKMGGVSWGGAVPTVESKMRCEKSRLRQLELEKMPPQPPVVQAANRGGNELTVVTVLSHAFISYSLRRLRRRSQKAREPGT